MGAASRPSLNRARERVAVGALLLIVALIFPPCPVALIVIGIASAAALHGGVPVRRWLAVLAAPAMFLMVTACIGALSLQYAPPRVRWDLPQLTRGVLAAWRALAATASVASVALTVPMVVLAGFARVTGDRKSVV